MKKLSLPPALGNVWQLLLGIVLMSFGICLISAVHLGTTPISSLPWALAKITEFSFGTTTFFCNLCSSCFCFFIFYNSPFFCFLLLLCNYSFVYTFIFT